ncbi:MAG: hydantoinase B/oxoprolinase family protein [Chloroflexota bacterium]
MNTVQVQVLGYALLAVAEEIGATLVRTAYTTNIKERMDCSAAVFDLVGNVIAQAEHIPIHLGSLLGIVENIRKRYNLDEIQQGDMFIANDPYSGGGTHLPDIAVAAPVFHHGKPAAFVANIAHHSDVGGRVPGSNAGDSTSIFQEGIRIPVMRIIEQGELNRELMALILLNTRTPEERKGDLQAQFAANRTGVARMEAIVAQYGLIQYNSHCAELLDYAERKLRLAIDKIPDGQYTFHDYMDDDGVGQFPLKIQVQITVCGDQIHLDFEGTDGAAQGAINVVRTALMATVYFAIKSILDPTIPPNAGYFRAIEIDAPIGTIVNPQPPSPVAGRTDTCQRIVDVIYGALAQAAPERVPAASNGAVTALHLSGINPTTGKYYVYPETLGGGGGARPTKDGMDGVHSGVTNTSNLPIEALEMEYPLRVERYELVTDSGGTGAYRGGMALRRDIRILDHQATLSTHGDRLKFAPWGLAGGEEGGKAQFVVNPGSADEHVFASGKVSEVQLKAGDILRVQTAGGGGYGHKCS